jgi:hypothetical protein
MYLCLSKNLEWPGNFFQFLFPNTNSNMAAVWIYQVRIKLEESIWGLCFRGLNEVLSRYLPWSTEENHEERQHRLCPARNSDLERTEYKCRSLSLDCPVRCLTGGVMQFFTDALLFTSLIFTMKFYSHTSRTRPRVAVAQSIHRRLPRK